MSFSEMSDRHKQCLDIAMKTFTRMMECMIEELPNEVFSNTDFEAILVAMIKIYMRDVVEKLEPEQADGAIGSLFSCIIAIFVPIMDAEQGRAMMEEVFDKWEEFKNAATD